MQETGLDVTFRRLAKSPNRAASRTAIGALESCYFEIRRGAVQALAQRPEPEGHLELLDRWDSLGSAIRSILPKHRERFVATLAERLPRLAGLMRTNAVQAAGFLGACELLPGMIAAATRGSSADREAAERAAVHLAGILTRERAAERPRISHRTALAVERKSLDALRGRLKEAAARPFSPLFEIYLILSAGDAGGLESALAEDSPLRKPLLTAIGRTRNPVALSQTLDLFAESKSLYRTIADALRERRDPEYLEAILKALESHRASETLKRLRSTGLLDWLRPDERTLRDVPTRYRPLLVRLTLKLTDHPPKMQEVLEGFYEIGEPEVRREALRLARKLSERAVEALLKRAASDPDPRTAADAVAAMREKGSPDVCEAAVEAIRRGRGELLEGVRRALPELTHEALLRRADAMEPEDLQAVGRAIFQVRPESVEKLRSAVATGDRALKLRALRLIERVGAIDEFEPVLVMAVEDGDRQIREEALKALARGTSERSADALAAALSDELDAVRELAERLLNERIARPVDERPPVLDAARLRRFLDSVSQGHGSVAPLGAGGTAR